MSAGGLGRGAAPQRGAVARPYPPLGGGVPSGDRGACEEEEEDAGRGGGVGRARLPPLRAAGRGWDVRSRSTGAALSTESS